MCDYSLHLVASRPAKVGDKLVATDFVKSITGGFLSAFVLYDHHQSGIVVRALFLQLHDFALGIRKCRCNIRQVCTMRVILNPTRSAYCEEISRHPNAPRLFGPRALFCNFLRVP